MTRAEIIDELVRRHESKARATIYADAFLEYQEASANIQKNGTIVQHPRTSNPIENPYLVLRDRAGRKLEEMKRVDADFLW